MSRNASSCDFASSSRTICARCRNACEATHACLPPFSEPHDRSYARAVLGKELVQRLGTTRVLMVGAGGIGCELLKNVVTAGFGYIEIVRWLPCPGR
jgi:hypothetical protein